MKLQAIRYFIAVVEAGGFRAAANAIQVSQSVVTAALQQLERELGAPLLHRSRRGVIPTPFGRAFLERARTIDRESRKALEEIAQLRGHWEGSVCFATSPAVGIRVIPAAIRAFRERLPDIRVRCVDGMYPGVLGGLRDGQLDFAIGPYSQTQLEAPFVAERLLLADVVIACQRQHPKRNASSLMDLADCEWVLSAGAGGTGFLIERAFQQAGLGGLKVGMVCESPMALPGIVALSDMLGTLPRAVLDDTRWRQQLTMIPIRERLPVPPIGILRRNDMALTPAAAELITWVRHFASKLGDPASRDALN